MLGLHEIDVMQLDFFAVCQVGEVLCGDEETCIIQEWVCDGNKDCHNGWDENSCGEYFTVTLSYVCKLLTTGCVYPAVRPTWF